MLMIREDASAKIKAMKIKGQPNQEFHKAFNRLAEAMGIHDEAIYMWIITQLVEKQIARESELKLIPKVKNGTSTTVEMVKVYNKYREDLALAKAVKSPKDQVPLP